MSRNYSVPHQAAKDLGNNKLMGWIDAQTSQLDFSLPKGIGGSPIGSASQVLSHLAVGVHTQGSKIEALHPLMTGGGVYIDYASAQTSAVDSGQAQIQRMNNYGAMYTESYPKSTSALSGAGSADDVKSASGFVYEFGVSWSDCNVGNIVRLTNGDVSVRSIVFAATSGNEWARLPAGGIPLDTSVRVQKTVTGGGGASIYVSYL